MWEIQEKIVDCKFRWRDGDLQSSSIQRFFWALPKIKLLESGVWYPVSVSRARRNYASRHSVQPTAEQRGKMNFQLINMNKITACSSFLLHLPALSFHLYQSSRNVPIQHWSVLMAVGTFILQFRREDCPLWSWRGYYIAVSSALHQSLTNALCCSIQRGQIWKKLFVAWQSFEIWLVLASSN